MTALQQHHSTSALDPGFATSSCRTDEPTTSLPRFSKAFGAKGEQSVHHNNTVEGYVSASTVPRTLPANAQDMTALATDKTRLPSLSNITSISSSTFTDSGKRHGHSSSPMAGGNLQNLAADALHAVVGTPQSNPMPEFASEDIEASTRRLSLREEHLPSLSILARDVPPRQTHLKPEGQSPPSLLTPSSGELPPLQMDSPRSESASQRLPSIRSTFGDINRLPAEPPTPVEGDVPSQPSQQSVYARSPSSRSTRLPSIASSQVSPPISPSEGYQRNLPSPHSLTSASPYHFPTGPIAHRPGRDNGIPSDASSPDQTLSNSTQSLSASSRMSIDVMTNPPGGTYVCTFEGCNAHPFQTQYLLNSHANVHSSARPHYCPVKGCPRSEGGKGFKRKNEMIRHGLVHDSPGYVCPFCPDREHKYPRPDNLQRYALLVLILF